MALQGFVYSIMHTKADDHNHRFEQPLCKIISNQVEDKAENWFVHLVEQKQSECNLTERQIYLDELILLSVLKKNFENIIGRAK